MKSVVLYVVCVLVCFGIFIAEVSTLNDQIAKLNDELGEAKSQVSSLEYLLERDERILRDVFGGWSREHATYGAKVTVTAYSSTVDQTDSSPYVTADGSTVRRGYIAVSRDLLTELGLTMGQRVLLVGYGVFEIRDKMNARFSRRVDIWMADRKAAKLHGVKHSLMIWFGKG
jgi:3D (Asp-Asp-Asp) domain-containing protein